MYTRNSACKLTHEHDIGYKSDPENQQIWSDCERLISDREINHILVELFLQTLRCYMTSSWNVHFLCYFYIWFWRKFQHLDIQDRLKTFEDACNYFGLVSLRLFCVTFRKSLTDFYRSVYLSRIFFEASKTNSFRFMNFGSLATFYDIEK